MAANLWVWNTPRAGFAGNPKNPNFKGAPQQDDGKKLATFRNLGTNDEYKDAELYFEDQFWDKLDTSRGDVRVNTYEGHVWNVRVDGKTVKTWVIEGKEKEFVFEI
jgi:hypothetical protein